MRLMVFRSTSPTGFPTALFLGGPALVWDTPEGSVDTPQRHPSGRRSCALLGDVAALLWVSGKQRKILWARVRKGPAWEEKGTKQVTLR